MFTQNASGAGVLGKDTVKISVKAVNGVVAAQDAVFKATFKAGSFVGVVAVEGVTVDADVTQPAGTPVMVLFNGQLFAKKDVNIYTTKGAKSWRMR